MLLQDISASVSGLLSRRVRPTSFEAVLFCSFHCCVISLFCLCLQGWPMNRQLRKGPQIFHRSVSESRASLPRAGVTPSSGLPSLLGGCMYSSAKTAIISYCLESLVPLFLQHSVKQNYVTVFGTIASSLSSFIFGLVCFYSFLCFQWAWETKNDVFEA